MVKKISSKQNRAHVVLISMFNSQSKNVSLFWLFFEATTWCSIVEPLHYMEIFSFTCPVHHFIQISPISTWYLWKPLEMIWLIQILVYWYTTQHHIHIYPYILICVSLFINIVSLFKRLNYNSKNMRLFNLTYVCMSLTFLSRQISFCRLIKLAKDMRWKKIEENSLKSVFVIKHCPHFNII